MAEPELIPVVYYPDEVLRLKAEPVGDITPELVELARRMVDTMNDRRGIGLAAPQVGRSLRLFVVGLPDLPPRFFFNPEIVQTSVETGPYEEGCLSLPGIYADVKRPLAVTVQAFNEKGRPFRLDAEGLMARVVQHEIDHLNGVLFFDYLSELKQKRLLAEFAKRQKM